MSGAEMCALPDRCVTQIKLISGHNPYSGKDPQCRFFCAVKGGANRPGGPSSTMSVALIRYYFAEEEGKTGELG